MPELNRLRRFAVRATLRLRLSDGLSAAAAFLPFPLLYAVAALTAIKVFPPAPRTERVLVAVGAALLAVAFALIVRAIFRSRPWYAGALALDRHHRLDGRLTNALAFDRVPEAARAPLMRAAIEDAVALAADLSPRRAVPLRPPRDLAVSVLLAAGIFGISALEVRTERVVMVPLPRTAPLLLSADDVALFREAAEEMATASENPEVVAAVRRFNQLLEDVAEQRLDRHEVFRRLTELESGLVEASELDSEALEEGLDGVARELTKSDLSRKVGDAIEQKRLQDAEQALRDLAERLKDKKPVDRAKLEQLRRSLERASKASAEKSSGLQKERDELEKQRKRLLEKKNKGPLSKRDQAELEKLDRKLERLDRQKKRAESAQKQMSELDRDLARAAQELMKELGDAAKELQKGAEDLNRAARKQMSQREKEELKRKLEEMRQLLRQEGQGGKDRIKQLMRFGDRARGGKPGQGKDGKGQGRGEGKDGKGSGRLVLRPGSQGGSGVDVLMPGSGAPMPGQGSEQGQGSGASESGSEWGSAEGGDPKGEQSKLAGKAQDVSAAGIDTGEGPSTSQVIYGAADRGFVGRNYQKVFTEYRTVAEEALVSDEIPPGYEFYVRRYFQLIRPRE